MGGTLQIAPTSLMVILDVLSMAEGSLVLNLLYGDMTSLGWCIVPVWSCFCLRLEALAWGLKLTELWGLLYNLSLTA